MWKVFRITLLLAALAAVAINAWLDERRTHSWHDPLYVGLIPLAGDSSPVTAAYLAQVEAEEFEDLDRFFGDEARRVGLALLTPVHTVLYRRAAPLPPAPPVAGGALGAMLWSLRLRAYAWRHGKAPDGATPPVRVFLIYHDPALTPTVPHSAGLEKGLIGVAHLFATPRMQGSNAVVIAHELLHTLGATDKYDPRTNLPLFPDGYGDPGQSPRFPQRYAEIMAGRRALSPTAAEMPATLEECRIGPATAAEIHWSAR
jgi:hypothetical protein